MVFFFWLTLFVFVLVFFFLLFSCSMVCSSFSVTTKNICKGKSRRRKIWNIHVELVARSMLFLVERFSIDSKALPKVIALLFNYSSIHLEHLKTVCSLDSLLAASNQEI
ncbi:hypothetical protein EDC96DRAFT_568441 [Choanephora cucurbitarum]|nr:hypothetical protein EDC96DRAFT_568441 [Choanephora cucurbitarum]